MSTTKVCDICHNTTIEWVDGATKNGPWANMCINCYNEIGIGIGIGLGQQYLKGVKIAG